MNRMRLLMALLSALVASGCSRHLREIELTMDNIWDLDPAKVNEVIIDSPGPRDTIPYRYRYVITDRRKTDVILRCVRELSNPASPRRTRRAMRFRSGSVLSSIAIDWDDRSVYGWWWESTWLRKYFEHWNLFEAIAAADPKRPPPKWYTNPELYTGPPWPPDTDPNDDYEERLELFEREGKPSTDTPQQRSRR